MHEGTFNSSLLPHLSYNIHHPVYLLSLVDDPQYHIPGRLGGWLEPAEATQRRLYSVDLSPHHCQSLCKSKVGHRSCLGPTSESYPFRKLGGGPWAPPPTKVLPYFQEVTLVWSVCNSRGRKLLVSLSSSSLDQCFSTFNVHVNSTEIILKMQTLSQ